MSRDSKPESRRSRVAAAAPCSSRPGQAAARAAVERAEEMSPITPQQQARARAESAAHLRGLRLRRGEQAESRSANDAAQLLGGLRVGSGVSRVLAGAIIRGHSCARVRRCSCGRPARCARARTLRREAVGATFAARTERRSEGRARGAWRLRVKAMVTERWTMHNRTRSGSIRDSRATRFRNGWRPQHGPPQAY